MQCHLCKFSSHLKIFVIVCNCLRTRVFFCFVLFVVFFVDYNITNTNACNIGTFYESAIYIQMLLLSSCGAPFDSQMKIVKKKTTTHNSI